MTKNKEPSLLQLGKNIRDARNNTGLSQENLALKADLDRTYVGGLERGERNPTELSMLKLTQALKVSLSELLVGVSHEKFR